MDQRRFLLIAVDGGAASGKSSSSRALSERFHLLHVDTGSYYRALTWKLLEAGVQPHDVSAVRTTLARLPLATRVVGRTAVMDIDGWTPGEEIRGVVVNEHVSRFAALPELRRFLLEYQRRQADVARHHGFNGLVMEGRDIGSVIFPDADLRFFLSADPAARARRRAAEGREDQIHERDKLDQQRANSPLVCPPGAIAIDSTNLTLTEVVEQMAGRVTQELER